MYDDNRTAYLFRCGDEDLFGVTHDQTGANLPGGRHARRAGRCERISS